MDNKERASWFAKYWGAEVLAHRTVTKLIGVINDESLLLKFPGGTHLERLIDDCKLILTHISDISDTDKLNIGRLFDDSAKDVRKVLRIITGVIEYHYLNSAHSKDYTAMEWAKITGLRGSQLLPVSDYLRSKSYNIDDLPEEIAVRKEVGNAK